MYKDLFAERNGAPMSHYSKTFKNPDLIVMKPGCEAVSYNQIYYLFSAVMYRELLFFADSLKSMPPAIKYQYFRFLIFSE